MTDEGLACLKNLQHLSLRYTTGIDGSCFRQMPELQTVKLLSGDPIPPSGLKILFEFAKNLKLLEIYDFARGETLIADYIRIISEKRQHNILLKIRSKIRLRYYRNNRHIYKVFFA